MAENIKNTMEKLKDKDKLVEIENAVNSNKDTNSYGETDYPILEFDKRSLDLLSEGVRETLKCSDVKVNGGLMYDFFKRLIDIVASFCGIVLLLIPMIIIGLIVFFQDGGKPIFSQVRLTKNGKIFRIYKFRSMCVDAEEKFYQVQKENETDGVAFKSENDPRITKFGKFIRKTSLDELPQLFNVIRGDMSIIGPRPPLPREVVLYTPEHMNRLLVKGGLACTAQCEGRSEVEFEKWVESDIEYIENRTLWIDLKLFLRTIGVVVLKKGAK